MSDLERSILDELKHMRERGLLVIGVKSADLAESMKLSAWQVCRALGRLKREGLVLHRRSWVWDGMFMGGHHEYRWELPKET